MNRETDWIGREGERRAEALLDAIGWMPRKDQPDNGCDFNIEVPATSTTPAERVFIQVKASKKHRRLAGEVWSVPVERRPLQRYERMRHPVFLIAVDLHGNEIRWLDLQAALLESNEADKSSRSKRGRVRCFHLPPTQVVTSSDSAALATSIRNAIDRQNDCHHSPATAMAYRSARMEALDPRIGVEGEFIKGREQYTLRPRETIHFSVCVPNASPEERSRLIEAMKYGQRVQIDGKAIKIEGSELLKQIGSEAVRLTIEANPRPCRVRLYAPTLNADLSLPVESGPHLDIEGSVRSGPFGLDLELTMTDVPTSVSIRFPFGEDAPTITWSVDFESWVGKPVARLPYLKPLLRLLNALCEQGRIGVSVHQHGEILPLSTATLPEELYEFIKAQRIYLIAVNDLATLCQWLGSDLDWGPEPLDAQELAPYWAKGVQIIKREATTLPVTKLTLRGSLEDLQSIMGNPMLERGKLTYHTTLIVNAWDEMVGEIPIELDFAGAKLEHIPDQPGCLIVRPPEGAEVPVMIRSLTA